MLQHVLQQLDAIELLHQWLGRPWLELLQATPRTAAEHVDAVQRTGSS
jgi:hypothetical protein